MMAGRVAAGRVRAVDGDSGSIVAEVNGLSLRPNGSLSNAETQLLSVMWTLWTLLCLSGSLQALPSASGDISMLYNTSLLLQHPPRGSAGITDQCPHFIMRMPCV